MAAAIALEKVSKRHGRVEVLRDVDFSVDAGTTVALLGPSGGGKSTLLRLVIGLALPDSGRVVVGGQTMTARTKQAIRRGIGYVIQEGALFPHLTARENAALAAEQLGWERARLDARVEELRALVQLPPDAIDRFPAELSGGQRQRVGIMRALFLDPAIVLLDEPLGALDTVVRARLRADLAEIFARLGKTVLLVTHDLADVEALAREAAVLEDGRVVQRGTPAELRAHPATPLVAELVHAEARA